MVKSIKAQSDMMGLVVIVLIFTIAISFLIFFTSKDTENPLKAKSLQVQAVNTIISMRQTNTQCRDLTIGQIIGECAWTNSWTSGSCSSPSGDTPCDYANDVIGYLLEESLGSKNKDYYFVAYKEDNVPVLEFGERCKGDFVSETQPLKYNLGNLFITLEICERVEG